MSGSFPDEGKEESSGTHCVVITAACQCGGGARKLSAEATVSRKAEERGRGPLPRSGLLEPAFTSLEQTTTAARVTTARAGQETGRLTLGRDGRKLRMAHGRYCSRAVRRREGGTGVLQSQESPNWATT